tara:strand:- start:4840 stop:5199 length:360 start_codon:yes stop_codon:yes gene_type:complete
MGYISEVAIVASKDAYSRLMACLAGSIEATKHALEAITDENYGGTDEGNLLFRWEWIKWYDTTELVKRVEDWMNKEDSRHWLASDETEYQFIRIGESVDDCEERGNPNYGLMIERAISF